MKNQSYLYGAIGLLLGLIIGYIGTDHLNRNAPPPQQAVGSSGESELPANHPPTGSESGEQSSKENGPQGEVSDAIEKARKAPSDFDAQMKAAEMFIQIGRGEGALEFYERAAKIKPNNGELLTALGNGYFDLKRYPEAEKWYQAALKVNPKDPSVWMDLGLSYYLREPRDLEKAAVAYRSALRADPRHEKTLQNLTRALLDQGDKAGAKQALAQLEQVNPGNTSISQFRSELP